MRIYCIFVLTKVITYAIIGAEFYRGGDCKVSRLKSTAVPESHTATEFLRGQASKIFDTIVKNDNVVIVNKNSKPQNVIISYERYKRLKENGADI